MDFTAQKFALLSAAIFGLPDSEAQWSFSDQSLSIVINFSRTTNPLDERHSCFFH